MLLSNYDININIYVKDNFSCRYYNIPLKITIMLFLSLLFLAEYYN